MENLGILITIFGISVVSLGSWALFQFAPKIQGMLDSNSMLGGDQDSANKSLQPLYKVFYKFAHSSSNAWIDWILAQDKDTQDKAFDKLQSYLEGSPEELGIATQEVIKAVIRFKNPNSFDILSNLLINVRLHLGLLQCIDLFYLDLCKGIIELDTNRGTKVLTNELQVLKQRESKELATEDFKISIIKALGSIKVVNDELREIFVKIITDRNFGGLIRKELIRALKDREDSLTEYIYVRALESHLDSSSQVLNKDHQTVLEELFNSFKHFISKNNKTVWDLLIKSCYNDSTRELFTGLIINMVINPQENFHEDQLMDLLNSQDPVRDGFRGALAERFKVTNNELSIFRSKLKPEDITFNQDILVLEKSKKTKVVTVELLPIYYKIEEMLNQELNQTNKSERKSKHAISLITGTGNDEKIYILRGLAANGNRSFVYIDLAQMILCSTELNKLISTISNSKPSIVYIDKLLEVFKKDLDAEEEIGLKHFLKSVRELSILPTVSFFGGLSIAESEIAEHKGLSTTINTGGKGSYKILMNIDKPDRKIREEMMQDAFKKISLEKIDDSFSLDALLEETENISLLKFLSFFIDFLEKSLMIHGKIENIKSIDDEATVSDNENPNDKPAMQEVLN